MTTHNPFDDTDHVLDRITDRFEERYDGEVPREKIEQEVHETYTELAAKATVDRMLPALTEHEVADRLAEEVGRPAPLTDDSGEAAPQLRADASNPESETELGRPVGPT